MAPDIRPGPYNHRARHCAEPVLTLSFHQLKGGDQPHMTHSRLMTSVLTRRLRWLLPAGIAAGIAAASLTAAAAADASAQPKLDAQTAAQLLVAVEHANPAGFSGTIVENTNLGLPQLPDVGGATDGSGLDVQTLITGSHTANVWYAGICLLYT